MDDSAPSAARRPELTTAQLAERVDVPAGTLRMWEARYGFPAPRRLSSGHRRYTRRDADQLREVVRLRDTGMSLPAAILATQRHGVSGPASIFARVRERCRDLRTIALEQGALLQLTRAIEDEYLDRGSRGVVIGSFQRMQSFRAAAPRWSELARAADLAIALADFPALQRTHDGVWEVPVSHGHALGREWSLLLYSPTICGALAAWELPGSDAGSGAVRRFEVLFSSEPAVVHTATGAAAELVHDLAPSVGVPGQLGPTPAESTRELRAASALAHRTVEYLLGPRQADV